MKVLVINTVAFRLNGITSVIMNYYRKMDCTDMQIDFFSSKEICKEIQEELQVRGANVYYLPRKKNLLLYQLKLYHLMKKNRYDIVHIHGSSAMMLVDMLPAAKAKIPVRIAHAHNTACSHTNMHRILRPLFNHWCTHRFACGQEAGMWLFKNKPFEVIPNGIDLKLYRYNKPNRKKYRVAISAKDKVVIGCVGNFNKQKNHVFLLDVYAELVKENKNCLLLLIGYGYLMNSIIEKAHRLNIDNSVLFLGGTREVYNYLQAMDIFVLPSLYEGLPVALVEAQASGLHCIVSDTITKEVDLTSSMSFVSIDNTQSWVKEINKKIKQLSESNRESACNEWQKQIAEAGFDIDRNVDRMKNLYWEYFEQCC